MRLVLLSVLLAGAAGPALAADAPSPAPAAAPEPPICTTVTTVVKRGDVVLSTNSTTKCEAAEHPGGGISIHPGEVLAAPAKVFTAPAVAVDAIFQGHGDLLTQKNSAGDWRVVNSRTGDVCRLILSVRTTNAGFAARVEGCRGELAHAGAWTYRDGGTEVLGHDGKMIVRLTGTRDLVKGSTVEGDALTLQR
jgi:hypothetical protein